MQTLTLNSLAGLKKKKNKKRECDHRAINEDINFFQICAYYANYELNLS